MSDARVAVLPWGIAIDVASGETLFDAALRSGVSWPTNCYGQARCVACRVVVNDGADGAPVPAEVEAAGLARLARLGDLDQPAARLACQLRPFADMTVTVVAAQRRAGGPDEQRERWS